jgi:hypothetical protein
MADATGENGNPCFRQDPCGVRARRRDPNGESGLIGPPGEVIAGLSTMCRNMFCIGFCLHLISWSAIATSLSTVVTGLVLHFRRS